MTEILVVYYSQHGSVTNLAKAISHGIESVAGCSARIRTVPGISANTEATEDSIPDSGPPYVSLVDLEECDGIIIGSPSYFGNMAAPLKYFFDQSIPQWFSGALVSKPAAAFASSSSLHGGQESVLLSMLLPLIHHGCIVVGLPYTEASLTSTQTGGTPYGATHVSGHDGNTELSDDEKTLSHALGQRLADIASRLKTGK